MSAIKPVPALHPKGEASSTPNSFPPPHRVDTFGGPVEVHWEPAPAVTRHGLLAYFIDFLKTSNTWTEFVDSCPLTYSSPNAPLKAEVLATIIYSILTGQRRYSHITALSGDAVMAGLFGVKTFRSEDSVRRAFEDADDDAVTAWIDQQMDRTFAPLLEQPWVLDLDATIKTLYGHQEEARVGYNPTKPGRPSHIYQVMVLAAGKLVLNVDAQAGNQSASEYAQPTLWGWLDARDRKLWPTFLRGDIAHANEKMMAGAEERRLPYLFKLRQTHNVARTIARLARNKKAEWQDAGQGWSGVETELQLQGWTRQRRVIVLRKKLAEQPVRAAGKGNKQGQACLPGAVVEQVDGDWYEYAVLVTSWEQSEVRVLAQAYRDRADAENMFDELKNQWGWTGYTTKDLKRSQLMARLVGLTYNWWGIYTRMGTGDRHKEAITTRPSLMEGVAQQTEHARTVKLKMTSVHGKARTIAAYLSRISNYLRRFLDNAEQLEPAERWPAMLRQIFYNFCRGTGPLQGEIRPLAAG